MFGQTRNIQLGKLILALVFQDKETFDENAQSLAVGPNVYTSVGLHLKKTGCFHADGLVQVLSRSISWMLDEKSPDFSVNQLCIIAWALLTISMS